MKPWKFNGRYVLDTDIEGFYGFVYVIHDLEEDRFYIGKKFLVKPARKRVTLKNGKKKLKKILVESDWREYFSSNADIAAQSKENPDRFEREILVFCKGRGECAYMETKIQFERNALLDPRYYNGIVNCRINQRAVPNLRAEFEANRKL